MSICRARLIDLQNILPVTRKRPALPRRQAVAAVIRNSADELLFVQRPATGLLASLWKLPGSFIDDLKNIKKGLKDGVKEELGISIRVGEKIATANHAYTHFHATLQAFDCHLLKGTPEALECQDWCWVSPTDFKKLPLSKIDRIILATILSSA